MALEDESSLLAQEVSYGFRAQSQHERQERFTHRGIGKHLLQRRVDRWIHRNNFGPAASPSLAIVGTSIFLMRTRELELSGITNERS